MSWNNPINLKSRQYNCAHCACRIASSFGYFSDRGVVIYICPHCDMPTYFKSSGAQYPDIAPGGEVAHLPGDLAKLYKESRDCAAASSYTGSVLLCRKLLMNIAVKQGASEGQSFISYVNYLSDKGYIPPNGKEWVDHIRKKGNEATHEIHLMTRSDCEDLISFSEMLMRFIYEFPNRIPPATAE